MCGLCIIPEGRWGAGLKPGMFTISPQEEAHGSLPLPNTQNLFITRKAGRLLKNNTPQKKKNHKNSYLLTLLCFIKDILSLIQFYSTKIHITKILNSFHQKKEP